MIANIGLDPELLILWNTMFGTSPTGFQNNNYIVRCPSDIADGDQLYSLRCVKAKCN